MRAFECRLVFHAGNRLSILAVVAELTLVEVLPSVRSNDKSHRLFIERIGFDLRICGEFLLQT